MAIKKDDLISASDVNTYLAAKDSARNWNRSIRFSGNPDPISDTLELWMRDQDRDLPHPVGDATRGQWVSGTLDYVAGDTVIGLKNSDETSDGIVWQCLTSGTVTRPGELDVISVHSVTSDWKAVNYNVRFSCGLAGRGVTDFDIVKQKFVTNEWVDDYYVVSTNSADTPHYDWANWVDQQDGPDFYIYLEPGRYKIYFRNTRRGLGTSGYSLWTRPWQADMAEGEYIRTYKSDRSDFEPALVIIASATAGLLGTTVDIDGDPPGGN